VIFGSNRVWTKVECLLNLPGAIALAFVGRRHGFSQLAFRLPGDGLIDSVGRLLRVFGSPTQEGSLPSTSYSL
jgi:hypothetical protein